MEVKTNLCSSIVLLIKIIQKMFKSTTDIKKKGSNHIQGVSKNGFDDDSITL